MSFFTNCNTPSTTEEKPVVRAKEIRADNRVDTQAKEKVFKYQGLKFELDEGFELVETKEALDLIDLENKIKSDAARYLIKEKIEFYLRLKIPVLYKINKNDQCDLVAFQETTKVVFRKEDLAIFTKEFNSSLAKRYGLKPTVLESNFGSNYNNKYFKSKQFIDFNGNAEGTFSKYVISDKIDPAKLIYFNMYIDSFGDQRNDHEDIIATLDLR